MLANLSQQLVLVVAKQAEGQVVVDAVDWAIRVEQEETTEGSKHPNCSRVFQFRGGGEDNAVHFDFCKSWDTSWRCANSYSKSTRL